MAIASSGGGGTATADKEPLELPRGGRADPAAPRVVAFYGAPQDAELGVLGKTDPKQAAAKLAAAGTRLRAPGPAGPAGDRADLDARSGRPGNDGLYRLRQSDQTIRRYLAAARAIKALLILDIQPGHADFMDEVRALEPYLAQPDVEPRARPGVEDARRASLPGSRSVRPTRPR